jgi:hypothetical protein
MLYTKRDYILALSKDMKIFSTIKQLITFKPLLMQFVLEKVYYRKKHHINGAFHIQSNQVTEITAITIEATQTLKITKDDFETIVLGSKWFRKQISLDRLEKYEVDFEFPLIFPHGTKRERRTYRGDLWPLNKATDKAKKQLYVFEITAKIKFKGKKDVLTYTETINVE